MIFWFQLLGPLDTLTDRLLTLSYGRFNLRRVWVVPKQLTRSRPANAEQARRPRRYCRYLLEKRTDLWASPA